MRGLRIGLLQWIIGTFCAVVGALRLVSPHQFSQSAYAALRYTMAAGEQFAAYSRVPRSGGSIVAARPARLVLASVRNGRDIAAGILLAVSALASVMGLLTAAWPARSTGSPARSRSSRPATRPRRCRAATSPRWPSSRSPSATCATSSKPEPRSG